VRSSRTNLLKTRLLIQLNHSDSRRIKLISRSGDT